MTQESSSGRGGGRFRRGLRIAKVAWVLARGDGALAGLGLMLALLSTLLWVAAGAFDHFAPRLLALPAAFATTLVAVALCFAAAEALAGRACGIGEGIAAARARGRSVAAFSLAAGLVALALAAAAQSESDVLGWVGPLFWLVWWLATMFVAPEIALQGSGGLGAIRRSVAVLRRRWLETLGGMLAIGVCGFLALLLASVLLALDPPTAIGLIAFVAWGIVLALLQATWVTFTVVLQRDARGAAVARVPATPPAPFWRNPMQRRAWIAWSTAILVVVLFVGGFVAVRRAEDRRHKYDVEPPALASKNVLEFPLAYEEAIHEGTGIYWYQEPAGTVRCAWVRGEVLLVEVLLEPRFIPQAEAGGFRVHEEDGSSWITIIPTGLS